MKFPLHFGFSHRKITPYWPRANGECERFMWTLSKRIKSSIIERHSYQQQLHVFLRNYRATPHPSTGVPPSTLMFNLPMKVRLPQKEHFSVNNDSVKERDEVKQSYADNKHNVKDCK